MPSISVARAETFYDFIVSGMRMPVGAAFRANDSDESSALFDKGIGDVFQRDYLPLIKWRRGAFLLDHFFTRVCHGKYPFCGMLLARQIHSLADLAITAA